MRFVLEPITQASSGPAFPASSPLVGVHVGGRQLAQSVWDFPTDRYYYPRP
jgi:hypothetical protein